MNSKSSNKKNPNQLNVVYKIKQDEIDKLKKDNHQQMMSLIHRSDSSKLINAQEIPSGFSVYDQKPQRVKQKNHFTKKKFTKPSQIGHSHQCYLNYDPTSQQYKGTVWNNTTSSNERQREQILQNSQKLLSQQKVKVHQQQMLVNLLKQQQIDLQKQQKKMNKNLDKYQSNYQKNLYVPTPQTDMSNRNSPVLSVTQKNNVGGQGQMSSGDLSLNQSKQENFNIYNDILYSSNFNGKNLKQQSQNISTRDKSQPITNKSKYKLSQSKFCRKLGGNSARKVKKRDEGDPSVFDVIKLEHVEKSEYSHDNNKNSEISEQKAKHSHSTMLQRKETEGNTSLLWNNKMIELQNNVKNTTYTGITTPLRNEQGLFTLQDYINLVENQMADNNNKSRETEGNSPEYRTRNQNRQKQSQHKSHTLESDSRQHNSNSLISKIYKEQSTSIDILQDRNKNKNEKDSEGKKERISLPFLKLNQTMNQGEINSKTRSLAKISNDCVSSIFNINKGSIKASMQGLNSTQRGQSNLKEKINNNDIILDSTSMPYIRQNVNQTKMSKNTSTLSDKVLVQSNHESGVMRGSNGVMMQKVQTQQQVVIQNQSHKDNQEEKLQSKGVTPPTRPPKEKMLDSSNPYQSNQLIILQNSQLKISSRDYSNRSGESTEGKEINPKITSQQWSRKYNMSKKGGVEGGAQGDIYRNMPVQGEARCSSQGSKEVGMRQDKSVVELANDLSDENHLNIEENNFDQAKSKQQTNGMQQVKSLETSMSNIHECIQQQQIDKKGNTRLLNQYDADGTLANVISNITGKTDSKNHQLKKQNTNKSDTMSQKSQFKKRGSQIPTSRGFIKTVNYHSREQKSQDDNSYSVFEDHDQQNSQTYSVHNNEYSNIQPTMTIPSKQNQNDQINVNVNINVSFNFYAKNKLTAGGSTNDQNQYTNQNGLKEGKKHGRELHSRKKNNRSTTQTKPQSVFHSTTKKEQTKNGNKFISSHNMINVTHQGNPQMIQTIQKNKILETFMGIQKQIKDKQKNMLKTEGANREDSLSQLMEQDQQQQDRVNQVCNQNISNNQQQQEFEITNQEQYTDTDQQNSSRMSLKSRNSSTIMQNSNTRHRLSQIRGLYGSSERVSAQDTKQPKFKIKNKKLIEESFKAINKNGVEIDPDAIIEQSEQFDPNQNKENMIKSNSIKQEDLSPVTMDRWISIKSKNGSASIPLNQRRYQRGLGKVTAIVGSSKLKLQNKKITACVSPSVIEAQNTGRGGGRSQIIRHQNVNFGAYGKKFLNYQNKSQLGQRVDEVKGIILTYDGQKQKQDMNEERDILQDFNNINKNKVLKTDRSTSSPTRYRLAGEGATTEMGIGNEVQEVKDTRALKNIQLEDLQLIKMLGRGSFGTVNLVRHVQTEQQYALKCLRKEAIKGKKQIQHIKNERDVLRMFKPEDFCCCIFESLQDESNLYMVLEYLPGGELFKLIRKQIFMNEDDTRFYLSEIVAAIESLHEMNVIYRDLKPENILIDQQGHVKLIDFGFAKVLKNIKNDRAYTNCGTPGYCAPEVMLDHGHTYKADIWSIGILICEMIGGFTPFQNQNEASNPKAIMEKCRSGRLNLPKNLKGIPRDLVKQLLVDDPVSRLEISQIKQHKFFRGIDWDMLKRRKISPPYIPNILKDGDLSEEDDIKDDQNHYNTWREPGPVQDEISFNGKTPVAGIGYDECDFRGSSIPVLPPFKDSISPKEVQVKNYNLTISKEKTIEGSFYSSKKYSGNRGSGGLGLTGFSGYRKFKSPTRVLGDYQMVMVNKAFQDF